MHIPTGGAIRKLSKDLALLLIPLFICWSVLAESRLPEHLQNTPVSVNLNVDSLGISGDYRGALNEILLALQPDYNIQCDCPDSILSRMHRGTVENVSLSRFLYRLLNQYNYVLSTDASGRIVHIRLLSEPAKVTVVENKPYPGLLPIIDEKPIDFQTRQAFVNMPLSLRKHFDLASQETEIPPEWEKQFAVAYQGPQNPADLPPEFNVEPHLATLPPEQQEPFIIATDNPRVPVHLEELFYGTVPVAEMPFGQADSSIIPWLMTEPPDFTLQLQR